jgi:transposase
MTDGSFMEETVMQAYSMDLRVRVMADVDSGMSPKAASKKYRVSADWVRKLIRFRRETGDFGPRKQRVSHATKLDDHLKQLEQLVAAKPDSTLRELSKALPVSVGVSTVWRALRRLHLTFKKSSACRGAVAA